MAFNTQQHGSKTRAHMPSPAAVHSTSADLAQRHKLYENIYAFATGCILIVLGLQLLGQQVSSPQELQV